MWKNALVIFVASLVLAAAVALLTGATSDADHGGCPNVASAANAAAHASDQSAHGEAKQVERGCFVPAPTPEPTPDPTPEPAPISPADVQVVSVFVNAPTSSTAAVQFQISASVNLRNNGTASTVMVDTTFTPTLPPDCFATFGAVTVEDKWLPVNVNVSLSRSWFVTCAQAGMHVFTMDVTTAIDLTQPLSDPNPANNSGSGNDSTQVN